MVTLIMTSNFSSQDTTIRIFDSLVGTRVSVKNLSVQTDLKGDNLNLKSITIQSLSEILETC